MADSSRSPSSTSIGPGARDHERHLARYRVATHVLEQAFRIPGTSWRFGIDPLLGLIPGAGDVAGALLGTYGIWIAHRMGAPPTLQGRMLLNLIIDALGGAVPLIGDLFDFAYKAHVRNRILLETWLGQPPARRRSTTMTMVGFATLLIVTMAGAAWVAHRILRWALSQFAGVEL